MTEYSFVFDSKGKKLSPTKANKGWYLIRKKRAVLVDKYPMVIQLTKEVKDEEEDESQFVVGIDDGSKHVGIGIVQKCKTKNKPVFKGTIELRQDVSHLMTVRAGYRRHRRYHKGYRPKRFDNRSSSRRKNRIAPSIKQKKDSILRVLNRLKKYININEIHLEDVAIDIRALQEGKKLYKCQYQKSNRLDENLRKAAILRDNNTCQMCYKTNCKIEVHHIIPKRLKGDNSIYNLISLCEECHEKVTGDELKYKENLQTKINGKNLSFYIAQHVMQGKNYLREGFKKIAPLNLTTGGDTANKRIELDIEKSHANDALVITKISIEKEQCNIKDWKIKPQRRKAKSQIDELAGFKHRDLVKYTKRNGDAYIGYITAMYPKRNCVNITTLDGKSLKRYGIKRLKLLWRFSKIYWF
ncbi:MAG: HNH endonuclease [Halanaerobiales bacterium]|nr:HNH endonuclease [Halanaerobiales bacterium]